MSKMTVIILGKEKEVTEKEFDVLERLFGIEEMISDCCGASIDERAVCSSCGEHCGIVYVMGKE